MHTKKEVISQLRNIELESLILYVGDSGYDYSEVYDRVVSGSTIEPSEASNLEQAILTDASVELVHRMRMGRAEELNES